MTVDPMGMEPGGGGGEAGAGGTADLHTQYHVNYLRQQWSKGGPVVRGSQGLSAH